MTQSNGGYGLDYRSGLPETIPGGIGRVLKTRLNLMIVAAIAVEVASACSGLSRPTEDDLHNCLVANGGMRVKHGANNALAAAIGMYDYGQVANPTIEQLEWGTVITSAGGPVETSVGAPTGTKLFPARVHIAEAQGAATYWVFKDSFGQVRCVPTPGTSPPTLSPPSASADEVQEGPPTAEDFADPDSGADSAILREPRADSTRQEHSMPPKHDRAPSVKEVTFATAVFGSLKVNDFDSFLALLPKPPFTLTWKQGQSKADSVRVDESSYAQQTAMLHAGFTLVLDMMAAEGVRVADAVLRVQVEDNSADAMQVNPDSTTTPVTNIYLLLDTSKGTFGIRLEDCLLVGAKYWPEQLKWYGKR